MGEIAARVTLLPLVFQSTVTAKKMAARDNKRKLVATRSTDVERLRALVAPSEIITLTALEEAGPSAAVRTASGVTAVAGDAGAMREASRGALRAFWACASDLNGQLSGGRMAAILRTLENINLDDCSTEVVAGFEEAMREAPKCDSGTRGSIWRHNREVGLCGWSSPAPEVLLGSTTLYFGIRRKENKRAAQRYVSSGEGKGLAMVKLAKTNTFRKKRVYTGATVTCGELTNKHVCDELMERANLVGSTVPYVLASPPTFVLEMRRKEDDLIPCFEHPPERPSTA